MFDLFTRREKFVLFVFGLLLVLFFIFPALLNPDYEIIYMFFIVLPIGYLIATDKERIQRTKE